jgi:hypothetical protein
MKRPALIQFLLLSLAACGPGQPCPTCDDDGADDDQPADMADELPDLPCGGADLQNDDWNCGTCGNPCVVGGADEYEAGGCIDGVCGPSWFGNNWFEPTSLTCNDVCATATGGNSSCRANGCVGLTGFICQAVPSVSDWCEAFGGPGSLLLELSGPCDESIPWPDIVHGGVRLVLCCCG